MEQCSHGGVARTALECYQTDRCARRARSLDPGRAGGAVGDGRRPPARVSRHPAGLVPHAVTVRFPLHGDSSRAGGPSSQDRCPNGQRAYLPVEGASSTSTKSRTASNPPRRTASFSRTAGAARTPPACCERSPARRVRGGPINVAPAQTAIMRLAGSLSRHLQRARRASARGRRWRPCSAAARCPRPRADSAPDCRRYGENPPPRLGVHAQSGTDCTSVTTTPNRSAIDARLAACNAAASTTRPSMPGRSRVAVAPATTVGA